MKDPQPIARCSASGPNILAQLGTAALIVSVWLLTGCGGSAGNNSAGTETETGDLLITLTDVEGDFLTYTVDVVSITLERSDGLIVETLPNTAQLDFTQYVDLTELFTAVQVPTGRYVGGSITLDYTGADIQVEVAGIATPAGIVDEDGNVLGLYTLDVQLENGSPLVIAPGHPALLSVDFDLDASHSIDTLQSPPLVTATPFLVADIAPVGEKDLRVRGPLVAVNVDASNYAVKLRPWHRRTGDFGLVTVHTTDATEFDIHGVVHTGAEGLSALALLDAGTPTVARGTLDVEARSFSAELVLAGDSVPGAGFDAVLGHVIARDGDVITVHGATIVSESGGAVFNDDVEITVGPDTVVTKRGELGTNLGTAAISVGQRLGVLGKITSDPAIPGMTMDATRGRVRLKLTHLSGTANTIIPTLLTMNLQMIGRRSINQFDFAGTGISADLDADPADYEAATGNLTLATITTGTPVRVIGFTQEFGAAPPDFDATTVVNLTDAHARLGIGWAESGATAPFLSIGTDGLVPDLANSELGERPHIKIGGVIIDLTELESAPTITGVDEGRRRFAILQGRRVQMFRNFDAFVETLSIRLDGVTTAKGLHALGRYDADTNTLTARSIYVHLIPPSVQ